MDFERRSRPPEVQLQHVRRQTDDNRAEHILQTGYMQRLWLPDGDCGGRHRSRDVSGQHLPLRVCYPREDLR